MTGLDPTRHVIVEIATLVTDDDLALVAEGPDLVVSATADQLGPDGPLRALDAHPLRAPGGHRGVDHEPRGGRGGHVGVPPASHPRSRHRPAGRELDRDRPPVPGRPAARDRGVLPLPLGRRLDGEGAGPPLASRRAGRGAQEAVRPPGAGRHQRERGRARLLPPDAVRALGPAPGRGRPRPGVSEGTDPLTAVERAFFEHPAVADCAVTTDDAGLLTAVVILRPGAKLTAEALVRHVRDRVGPGLVPVEVRLRLAPLPRDPGGGLRREELGAQLRAGPSTPTRDGG